VNLVLDPKQGITFSQGGMLAADGQCKAFDERADGLVRSDGCGAVVLMPLSHALARRARVYAVIRGSGASNDGFSNGLLATPSEVGQELAMRAAYRSAGLSPHAVHYIEAHGTGTRAGDPVELRALSAVMRGRPREKPCLVGSVKTNIGHTEGAAGVAGLIKAALAIHHRVIPKSLHFDAPTPLVAWDELGLEVTSETRPWPEGLARAGVSSFGISGTDVHMVLEELAAAPDATATRTQVAEPIVPERARLLLLSAMSDAALRATAGA
jgi:acyl transferase domain-containing protein